MKIYQVGKEGLKIPDETKVSSRKATETEGKSGPARKDRVILSQDVQRLIEIEKQNGEAVEVREELVENIKGKLQKGAYKPDNEQVAEKMLAFLKGHDKE